MSSIAITRAAGNKAYAAAAFIVSDTEVLAIGSVLSVTVEAFDAAGVSLGAAAAVSFTTTVEYTLYEAIRDWAQSIASVQPFNLWPTETSKFTGRMNVIPIGTGFSVALTLPVFTPA